MVLIMVMYGQCNGTASGSITALGQITFIYIYCVYPIRSTAPNRSTPHF